MTEVAASTARRLLGHVASAQSSGRLPSLVAAVVRDGSIVWCDGYGSVPGEVLDTQYRIGSITKTMTAVLILQLVRDGKLTLDTTVTDVVGEVGYGDRSVRSLLAHNAGLQSEPTGSWWERSEGQSFAELTAANPGTGGVFPSLSQFHYSNLGYALLGEVAARLHDQSWWSCVQSRVLEPLGLNRTSYLPTGVAAQGYSVDPYAGTLVEEPSTDTGAMAPAGQVWCTLADLATYAGFLVDGHAEVLDADLLHAAYVPQAAELDSALGYAHGLGFQIFPGGSGALVGHTGSMPGFLASCLVDRKRRTAAVTLANATMGLAPSDLATTLLEELERSEPSLPDPWTPTTEVPEAVRPALGVWHWGNSPYVFGWNGTELVASRNGVVKERFRLDGDRLVGIGGYHAGEELHVVPHADGSAAHLDIATFIYTRTPYDPSAPIPGG